MGTSQMWNILRMVSDRVKWLEISGLGNLKMRLMRRIIRYSMSDWLRSNLVQSGRCLCKMSDVIKIFQMGRIV